MPLEGELRAGLTAIDAVNWDQYDFIDFGSGRGASIEYCQQRFGAVRGVGLDVDPAAVTDARAIGLDVIQADVTEFTGSKLVRFVSMIDMLEHLPDLETVEAVLRTASEIASDFLLIWHPSFEGEAYLAELGLIQYWWHWGGHPTHIHVSDYCTMFDRLGLHTYHIRYRKKITNSSDPTVLPSNVFDQHEYDPVRHGPKPFVRFTTPIWRGQEIYVALRAFSSEEWRGITRTGHLG